MSTNSPFTVVGSLIYDSEHDELYREETIYDDDTYWINQREADDYRNEDQDFEPDFDEPDSYGDIGPGVDDFDDNAWGVD